MRKAPKRPVPHKIAESQFLRREVENQAIVCHETRTRTNEAMRRGWLGGVGKGGRDHWGIQC